MEAERRAVWINPGYEGWQRHSVYPTEATARAVADAMIARGHLALVLSSERTPFDPPPYLPGQVAP